MQDFLAADDDLPDSRCGFLDRRERIRLAAEDSDDDAAVDGGVRVGDYARFAASRLRDVSRCGIRDRVCVLFPVRPGNSDGVPDVQARGAGASSADSCVRAMALSAFVFWTGDAARALVFDVALTPGGRR